MSRAPGESDVLLPPGQATEHVTLLRQLYGGGAAGVGQCPACKGSGRIATRAGEPTTCPKCKGRGRQG